MPKKHGFHALWWHLGQYGRQDVHLHPCIDHEHCPTELVGEGRDCGGAETPHVERRLGGRWSKRDQEGVTPLMNRAERRRNERSQQRNAAQRVPVIIAGEGVVAAPLPHQFEGRPAAQLPPKETSKHRWICIASYVVTDQMAMDAMSPKTEDRPMHLLDHENLWHLAIGCVDCELPYETHAHEPCRAEGFVG